jgi:nucleoside-triphosphatase
MPAPTPLLFVITGARGAGKTTFCARIVEAAREAGWKAAGILSHAVFAGSTPRDGIRTAIEAEDLRTGARRTLARRVAADEALPTPGTKHWDFDPAAIDWGNEVLEAAPPVDLLIVDELGPLEFERDAGWQKGLAAVDSRQYAIALVVVRAELLGEALLRWGEANVVEIETPEDSAWKAEKLAEQLF